MNRRETLEQLSVIFGGAIALPIASGFLAGCQPSGDPAGWKPKILSTEQAEVLEIMSERIIPKTDSPGASEARVVEFLDQIVAEYFNEDEKEDFFTGLNAALSASKSALGQEFLSCSTEEQLAFLSDLDKEYFLDSDRPSVQASFFNTLKQFTIIGFYTSEQGATLELKMPVMGDYPGCVPTDKNTRAWAW